MTESFSPLKLSDPDFRHRAALPPRPPRFSELLTERIQSGERVKAKVSAVAKSFSELNPAQRKAVFFKIRHEGMPINLTGTGLKVFADGDVDTLAVATEDTLDKLLKKIDQFIADSPVGGHLKYEDLVFPMTDFSFGTYADRLSEAMLANYEQLIAQEQLVYEVELFAQVKTGRRAYLAAQLLNLKAALGVSGAIFEHDPNGDFVRAVVRSSGAVLKALVEGPEWQTRIVRFEQRPEFETFSTTLANFSVSEIKMLPPEESDSVICIVDSGVSSGNPFLETVVKESESQSFVADNSSAADEYNHGSGVASLAAFQELNLSSGAENKARAWIVNARILDANNSIRTRLLSKVLTEVATTYAAKGVQIFNLSVCVENKSWSEINRRAAKRSSWVARRIDQLSRDHDVVFVISAGNLTLPQVNRFIREGGEYPAYFISDECKLLDPSQAALAITVGSVAPGSSVVMADGTVVAPQLCPSPFTRIGPGILGEIKPEVVDFGGNWIRDFSLPRVRTNSGTNIMMASNCLTPAVHHEAGTSFAAPKISHKLARILTDLKSVVSGRVSAPLLRAALINSSSVRTQGGDSDPVTEFRESFGSLHSSAQLFGYGTPDITKATFGNEYMSTCFYQGQLEVDQVAFFRIPIPRELKSAVGKKRLFVTVAYAPPVNSSGLKNYLGSRMQWRLFRGDAPEEEIIEILASSEEANDEENESEEGLDDELDDSSSSLAGSKELKCHLYGLRTRSKGTIQHDVFEWTNHRESYSDNDYLLAVSLYKRWSTLPVPFAVVVRLEETSWSTPIYSKVKARIGELRVRTTVGINS